jgi:quercetin dioxygenase-like cupin family protein
MTHEDDRRSLTSIPYKDGELKIIITKQDCELGNHYHKVKTETFQLMQGKGRVTIKKKTHTANHELRTECRYIVDPGDVHKFQLSKDTILMCISSHPYDKNDDYEK